MYTTAVHGFKMINKFYPHSNLTVLRARWVEGVVEYQWVCAAIASGGTCGADIIGDVGAVQIFRRPPSFELNPGVVAVGFDSIIPPA